MSEKNQDEGGFSFKDKRRSFAKDSDETGESGQPERDSTESPGTSREPGQEGPSAPPINFSTFVLSLASSAAYHMGGFQDPVSGKTSVNLDLAKQSIDILAMLEEKTRGNLSDEEKNMISHSLYDLRMKFVDLK